MANPIENKQIAEALTEINKLGKAIEETFKDVAKAAEEIGKKSEKIVENLDFSKSKDIEKLNDMLKILTKETENLTDANKKRAKTSEELTKQEKTLNKIIAEGAEFNEQTAKEVQKLRLQRAAANKQAKQLAKEELNLVTTYDKQKQRLNELQKELINSTLEGKDHLEINQQLQKEYEELFTAISEAEQEFGNFRRQVGKYPDQAEAASKATERLERALSNIKGASIAFGAAIAAGGLVGKAINSNQDAVDGLREATEALDAVFNNVTSKGLSGYAEGVEATRKRQERFGKDTESFGNRTEQVLLGVFRSIENVGKAAADSLDIVEIQQKITRATIEYEKALKDTADGQDGLLTQLAKTAAEFEILTTQSEQNTLSLEDRNKLIIQSTKVAEEAFRIEREIASSRVVLFEQSIELAKENGTVTRALLGELTEARLDLIDVESREQQTLIQNAEIRRQILQDQVELELDILIDSFDNQKTINERVISNTKETLEDRRELFEETEKLAEESFERQQAAVLKLFQEEQSAREFSIQNNLKIQQRGLEQLRKLQTGEFIRGTRSQLEFRESLASLRTEGIITLEEEFLILEKQNASANRSILLQKLQNAESGEERAELQRKVLLQFDRIRLSEKKLDLEKFINRVSEESTKEAQIQTKQLERQVLTQEKLTQFLEASPIEQAKLRKELGVSEIISTRILEISRERRTVVQDLLDIQEDLNDAEFGQLETLADIEATNKALEALRNTDISNQEEADRILSDLDQERFENKKRFLKAEIERSKEGSEEEIQLTKELNDLLLEENKRARDEQNKTQEEQDKKDRDRLKSQKELRQELLDDFVQAAQFTANILDSISEKRLNNIDAQIDAINRREDQLREAFENGSKFAEDSITDLDEQRRILEEDREREIDRQIRRELFLAGANVLANTGNIQDTLRQLAQLRASIPALSGGFHDGGYTGDGGEWDIAGPVHKGEFVNTAKQVDNYGMKNWTASDFDSAVQSGYFTQFANPDYLNYGQLQPVVSTTFDQSQVINRLERVEDAIIMSIDKNPKHSMEWDEAKKEMKYVIETKQKRETLRRKSFRY